MYTNSAKIMLKIYNIEFNFKLSKKMYRCTAIWVLLIIETNAQLYPW